MKRAVYDRKLDAIPFGRTGVRISTKIVVGIAFFGFASLLWAGDTSAGPAVHHVDPGILVQRFNGPVTVVVSDNPFVDPWSVVVNQNVLTAPTVPSQLGPSIVSSGGSAGPAPAATPTGLTITSGPIPPPTPSPLPAAAAGGPLQITWLAPPDLLTQKSGDCDYSSPNSIYSCLQQLEARVDRTITYTLPQAFRSVCSPQVEFTALQRRAARVVDGIAPSLREHKFREADEKIRSLFGGARTDVPAGSSCLNVAIPPYGADALDFLSMQRRFETAVARREAVATVETTSAAIAGVLPYPIDEINGEQTLATALSGAIKVLSDTPPSTDSAKTVYTIKKTDSAGKTSNATVTSTPANKPASNGVPPKTELSARISAVSARLAPWLPTGAAGATSTYAQQYAASVAQLNIYRATVLTNVAINRFYVVIPEDCIGIYGGARLTTITVTRYTNVSNSVTVTCPARAVTSVGYGFSSLSQKTYQSVNTNPTFPQPPPGSPTPPAATIQATSISDIRPVPIVLLSVRFTEAEPIDNGWYLSFGVSPNSTSPSTTTLDYLAGVSYALGRTLMATFGFEYGPQTFLAPGYNVGDPYTANATPPTLTRIRSGYFLGITYGLSH